MPDMSVRGSGSSATDVSPIRALIEKFGLAVPCKREDPKRSVGEVRVCSICGRVNCARFLQEQWLADPQNKHFAAIASRNYTNGGRNAPLWAAVAARLPTSFGFKVVVTVEFSGSLKVTFVNYPVVILSDGQTFTPSLVDLATNDALRDSGRLTGQRIRSSTSRASDRGIPMSSAGMRRDGVRSSSKDSLKIFDF